MTRRALWILAGVWIAGCGGEVSDNTGAATDGGGGSSAGSAGTGEAGNSSSGGFVGFGGDAGSDAGAGTGGEGAVSGSGGTAGSAGSPSETTITISESPATGLETETNVAAAPNGFVVGTWIGVNFDNSSTNGYAFSADNGQTWDPPRTIDSPAGRVSSDPVVYADSSNNFHLTWIGLNSGGINGVSDMRVYYARADAGEREFGPVQEVTGAVASDQVDKPWITVDPNDGTIYITWLDTGEPRQRVAVSQDGGQTFVIHDIDDGQGFRNLIFPCVDAVTGRVAVVYHPGGGIGLRFSDDRGVTWPTATAVAAPGDQASFDQPTCAAHNNEIWIAYGIGGEPFDPSINPRSTRLRVAYSSDGGSTIARHAFAEDPAAGERFLHPQLTRGADGTLYLLYYAGSAQNPDAGGTVRWSRSTDGGATWQPSEIIQPTVFTNARGDPQWLGDYIGLYARSPNIYAVFADNRSGISHVNFFSTKIP